MNLSLNLWNIFLQKYFSFEIRTCRSASFNECVLAPPPVFRGLRPTITGSVPNNLALPSTLSMRDDSSASDSILLKEMLKIRPPHWNKDQALCIIGNRNLLCLLGLILSLAPVKSSNAVHDLRRWASGWHKKSCVPISKEYA